jgi:nitrite reductase (NADH) small subunit
MGLVSTLIFGRENGIRRTLVRKILGRGSPPPSSAPAPSRADAPPPAAEKALNLGVEAPKDVTPPEGFEVVLHKDALQEGTAIEVIIAGKAIAVSNVGGEYFACSNTCPHAEGPLGEGSLEGHVLTCPYHGWQFDVRDGRCLTQEESPVETYAVQIVDDAVCVAV